MDGRLNPLGVASVAAALAAVVVIGCRGETETLYGTELSPPPQARDFSLQNHRGGRFTLSDHAGETVILTFLYTSCTDVCPFVGAKLRQTIELLGDDAEGVSFVAISVDPGRDTLERVAEYSRSLGMYDRWEYLIGTKEELAPVWQSYFVGIPTIGDEADFATDGELADYGLKTGLDETQVAVANGTRHSFGGGYDVGHPTPVLIIDGRQRIRLHAGQSFDPAELTEDIRLLKRSG